MKEINSTYNIDTLISRYPALSAVREELLGAFEILRSCYGNGGKLLCCGNGGSAADSEHIVGELMKSFKMKRPLRGERAEALRAFGAEGELLAESLEGAMTAIALTGHTALSSAFANDKNPTLVFAQQVEGYGRKGDVLLTLTTSGNSQNCVYAAITARSKGMRVISVTGKSGGAVERYSDVCLKLPETETYLVQELTLPVYHWLCAELEVCFPEGTA